MNPEDVNELKKRYEELGEAVTKLNIVRDEILDLFSAVCNNCGTDNGQDCRACMWNIKATKDNLVDNWREE